MDSSLAFFLFNKLADAIMKCYNESKMTELDARLRYFTASTLQEMLKNMFPHCKAHLFGSCVNGFGSRNGDIDVMFDLNQDKTDTVSIGIFPLGR